MTYRSKAAMALIGVLLAVSACGAPGSAGGDLDLKVYGTLAPSDPGTRSAPAEFEPGPPVGGTQYVPPTIPPSWNKRGAAAVWPAYIPGDIPVPEGTIRKTMEGDLKIRIFYESMSSKAFDRWLANLKNQGFSLEYVVYIDETKPDNSSERIKKKDFDAVKITKGDYRLEITYGSTAPVLDIKVSGFEFPGFTSTEPTPSGPVWPVEYQWRIPQPERCPLVSVEVVPPSDYRITCRPADPAVADDYRKALPAAGFHPNTILPASDGSLDGSVYAWGSREITLDQPVPDRLIINISDITAKKAGMPAGIAGSVPQPEGCNQFVSSNLANGGQAMTCFSENPQVRINYINMLISSGFTETNRMELPSGELVSAEYRKGNLKLKLMLGQLSGMVIYVETVP